MAKTLHTAIPWKTDPDTMHESVIDDKDQLVADCAIFFGNKDRQKENQANANLIVTAVNSHVQLVAALGKLEMNLTEAQAIIRRYLPAVASLFELPLVEARTALALARGEKAEG